MLTPPGFRRTRSLLWLMILVGLREPGSASFGQAAQTTAANAGAPVPATDAPKRSRREPGMEAVPLAFFPAHPPPLGVEVVQTRSMTARQEAVPEGLADFLGDPFYAPLSVRLSVRQLRPDQAVVIDDYRRQRDTLLEELREHLYATCHADPETRLRMNTQFAREQSVRLAALEQTGDTARWELFRPRGLGPGEFDWNGSREWKLGRGALKRPREENAVLEYQVLRAAVFFQEGLVPAQRRLLLEVVMEMEDKVFRSDSQPVTDFGFVYFAPETARLRLPAGLPREAAALLEAFEREKAALKREIADAIYEADGRMFMSNRTKDLSELAIRQSARLASLEELAEDIRRELVAVPGLERPPVPPNLPPGLTSMVESFQKFREKLQTKLIARVRAAHASVPRPENRGPNGAEPADMVDYRENLVAAAERARKEFEEENSDDLLDLQQRLEAMAALIEKHLASEEEAELGGPPDAVISSFLSRHRKMETNFDYHSAVLEPGLSPEQRRLLFAAAIRGMNLPLPGGEPLPAVLPGMLLPIDQIGR